MPKKKKSTNTPRGWRIYPEVWAIFEEAVNSSIATSPRARQLDCVHAAMIAFAKMDEDERKEWLDRALTMNLED